MGSDVAAFLAVFFQHKIEQRVRTSEGGSPETFRRFRKVNQTGLRCQLENSKRSGHARPLAAGHLHAFAIIHQQQIGMKGDR